MACRQRCLALLGQVRREAGPGPVPAVAVTGSDLPGDGQALAHVGHARIGLADTALELAVEILVIEIQLHDVSPRSACDGGAAECGPAWVRPGPVPGRWPGRDRAGHPGATRMAGSVFRHPELFLQCRVINHASQPASPATRSPSTH